MGFSPWCPVHYKPSFWHKGKLCSCPSLMWQRLSLRCCQKYSSSTESSTGRESFFFFFFLLRKFPTPDFTFTVSLRVKFQTDWTPLLMQQKKKKGLSLNIPLKWKIRQWWSSLSLGGIHMNKIGWPAFFHFIEFRSGDDANSQMCRTIWPSPAMAEAAVSDGPHLHHNSKKLNHPQRSCVLIFLFLVIIYGCFSFITFVFSAAFFEKKTKKKEHNTFRIS